MNARRLAARSLRHYLRTNIAVMAGVACAVAVLSGALLVGDSVRGSLRAIAGARLGNADVIVTSETFFREQLSEALSTRTSTEHRALSTQHSAPLIVLPGAVSHEPSGRKAAKVAVYGVDERFFAFHGVAPVPIGARAARLSPALAAELGIADGDSVVIRVARPSDIPLESLHAQKDDAGRAIRVTSEGVLGAESMGEFAVAPAQGAHHAIFVPLARLQRELDLPARVNALLMAEPDDAPAGTAEAAVRGAATPEDLGLRVRVLGGDGDAPLEAPRVAIESDAGLIPDALARDITRAAGAAGLRTTAVFTYLANGMTRGDRTVPYSLVTAVDAAALEGPNRARFAPLAGSADAIILNDWAARDLGATVGDAIELSFYKWLDSGRLATETASFRLAAITPIEGLAADRRLAPEYPGITDTDSLSDWDPPFPVDLSLVRPIDEDYWDRHRTTPKAFIALEAGQRLWQSRWGSMTSMRVFSPGAPGSSGTPDEQAAALTAALRTEIDPVAANGGGLRVVDVRAESQDAAQGSADFGQYFLGFSFFLVVSALLLAALFFRLGVEQRLREIGLLTAVGFTRAAVRRVFLVEGLTLAVIGSVAGVLGALAYAAIVVHGLRTWWQGAVNTTAITLHVTPAPLAIGAVAGVVTAWLCIVLSIRGLRALSPRSLLSGSSIDAARGGRGSRAKVLALVSGASALLLVALGFMNAVPDAGAFFGAGMLMLVALLAGFNLLLRRGAGPSLEGAGAMAFARFGLRNASWRPGRSVLSAALVASAVFLIVSVDAFRKGGGESLEPDGGSGGFALVGESVVPFVHDLNTPQGREDAGVILDDEVAAGLTFYPLRLRPGDDTSCVNLYKPKRPRVVGVSDAFIDANRFTFADSIARSDEHETNPWLLLEQDTEPFPAVVDATSLQYVLHASVGDEIVIDEDSANPLRLRIVGSLRDSALQGEIIVGDAAFKRMFPGEQGYRMMLVEVAGDPDAGRLRDIAGRLESGMDQAGADLQLTSDRLAAYHRVENTYLSTFQSLGALGLLLGTFGLATVLARNVLERRRELALMRAVGFNRAAVGSVVLSEHIALLVIGMAAGALTAAVAIVPALAERGFGGGWSVLVWLAGIFIVGALVTVLASRSALGRPLLGELRSE